MTATDQSIYIASDRSRVTRLDASDSQANEVAVETSRQVHSIPICNEQGLIALVGNRGAEVWDISTHQKLDTFEAAADMISGHWLENGRSLLTRDLRGNLYQWTLGKHDATLIDPVVAESWSVTGSRIMSLGADFRSVSFFDVRDRAHSVRIELPKKELLSSAQWSADGTKCIGFGKQGIVLLNLSIPDDLRKLEKKGDFGPSWFGIAQNGHLGS
jgi:hypothetical protein